MTFNDSINKQKLKSRATSKITLYEVLSSLYLTDIGIYLRNEPFSSDI